jgi:hypothetical protein
MVTLRHWYFDVTGVANDEVLDDGIESIETEDRHLKYVLVNVSVQNGNKIVCYLDQDRWIEIPDYLIDTRESTGSTNTQKSTVKMNRIEVDKLLPLGEKFKIGVISGGTLSSVSGAYVYEPIPKT